MVESKSDFPFRKLKYDKYLTLEVMTFVEHPGVYNFMFGVNKKTRSYLQDNYIAVQNGFINGGLIIYQLKNDFFHYDQLEKLYI